MHLVFQLTQEPQTGTVPRFEVTYTCSFRAKVQQLFVPSRDCVSDVTSMSGFSLHSIPLSSWQPSILSDDFFLGQSVAFLYLTYGSLCDSESWGSWTFSSAFETERQPGRMIAKGHSSREVGRGPWVKWSSGALREQLVVAQRVEPH